MPGPWLGHDLVAIPLPIAKGLVAVVVHLGDADVGRDDLPAALQRGSGAEPSSGTAICRG
jgi:hypothetical protein